MSTAAPAAETERRGVFPPLWVQMDPSSVKWCQSIKAGVFCKQIHIQAENCIMSIKPWCSNCTYILGGDVSCPADLESLIPKIIVISGLSDRLCTGRHCKNQNVCDWLLVLSKCPWNSEFLPARPLKVALANVSWMPKHLNAAITVCTKVYFHAISRFYKGLNF